MTVKCLLQLAISAETRYLSFISSAFFVWLFLSLIAIRRQKRNIRYDARTPLQTNFQFCLPSRWVRLFHFHYYFFFFFGFPLVFLFLNWRKYHVPAIRSSAVTVEYRKMVAISDNASNLIRIRIMNNAKNNVNTLFGDSLRSEKEPPIGWAVELSEKRLSFHCASPSECQKRNLQLTTG